MSKHMILTIVFSAMAWSLADVLIDYPVAYPWWKSFVHDLGAIALSMAVYRMTGGHIADRIRDLKAQRDARS